MESCQMLRVQMYMLKLAVKKKVVREFEMINKSGLKPMFLDSLIFSSIVLGLVFYYYPHVFSGGYLPMTSTMAL